MQVLSRISDKTGSAVFIRIIVNKIAANFYLHEIFRIRIRRNSAGIVCMEQPFNGFFQNRFCSEFLYKKQTGIGRKAAAVEIFP